MHASKRWYPSFVYHTHPRGLELPEDPKKTRKYDHQCTYPPTSPPQSAELEPVGSFRTPIDA
ncbi:uncharacterized protein LACBIDRAFT_299073 [Laccaria bicolor S238N-H82]|uniref:Predicted protein n=1 Tax=Laccaria bicolor (strain S238N-H82 / ATCC MYA-4686) TaxID=486041 RepID=B0DDY9_LACBS|nr:uncharacterized protein LACBIDRAFT_299073 [Laccaria bicolor S238N-H82]EDR07170.1 predicted protein [Laccaria bicolor S238N-H82]|eukprot:XP_001882101.1 predicted protein [Laccaria bicolor S238N-H82]